MTEKVRIDGLSYRQEALITALLVMPTTALAAKKARISEKTAHAWLNDPIFLEAYRKVRRQAFDQAINALQDVISEAVRTLRLMMLDAKVSPSVRVRSAQILLENAIAVHMTADVEERLLQLEEAQKNREDF